MSPRRPACILFDLGNVLVHIEPAAFLRSLDIDTPENRRYYQPGISSIVRRYERGEDSTETFLERVGHLFNDEPEPGGHVHGSPRKFTPAEIREAMLTIIRDPVAGMRERVARLSTMLPIGLLSNTNPLHFHLSLERVPALGFIPTTFLSYELHALKPDRAIFDAVIGRLNLPPGEILYFDDIRQNVDAACSAGMRGVLFEDVDGLDRILLESDL